MLNMLSRKIALSFVIGPLFVLIEPPSPTFAQSQCPPGLTSVGRMEEKTTGLEVKVRPSINIPFNLDKSYHQSPPPKGSGGRATTILSTQQIPAGIHIIPDGGGSFGWAVSDPVMLDEHTFQMFMYCSKDQGVFDFTIGCGVHVDVCGKNADAPPTPPVNPPAVVYVPECLCVSGKNSDNSIIAFFTTKPFRFDELRTFGRITARGSFCRVQPQSCPLATTQTIEFVVGSTSVTTGVGYPFQIKGFLP